VNEYAVAGLHGHTDGNQMEMETEKAPGDGYGWVERRHRRAAARFDGIIVLLRGSFRRDAEREKPQFTRAEYGTRHGGLQMERRD